MLSLAILLAALSPQQDFADDFDSVDRVWIGPEYWANRLQDWRLRDGRVECVGTALPYRTLHLLTHRVDPDAEFSIGLRFGRLGEEEVDDVASGVLLGAGAGDVDPRAAALVQSAEGPDGGVLVGMDAEQMFIRSFGEHAIEGDRATAAWTDLDDVEFRVVIDPVHEGMRNVTLVAYSHGQEILRMAEARVAARALEGGIAVFCHGSGFWFDDLRVSGVEAIDDRLAGPILAAQHTLSRGVMKMTGQLMPVGAEDSQEVHLEVRRGEEWERVATSEVIVPGWTAPFRIEGWDATQDTPYRLVYELEGRPYSWEGTVRKDPVAKDELVLAALSCNHNVKFGFGQPGYPWNGNALWFPHADLVENVVRHEPDLLFFAGDQIYEGASPTRAEKKNQPELDYLYKWYLWCWAFGDLARDVPCVTIPDDHDVFQGNVWGAGGRATERDNEGGYVMPAEWVKMVERTQTSHLPDPFDPTPIEQGIGVYYTNLVYGRVGFAVLEDRKFKSGPNGLVEHDGPRPDHITNPDFDPATADVPGATLLGERQLDFVRAWAADWSGQDMKCALSQTVFANVATLHGGRMDRLVADLDSNGWPQSGRNRALRELRRGFAFHVAGDQHLSTIVRHGIDDWDDAGWTFTVPAIANFYARAWVPLEPGRDREPGMPEYTGRFLDGLGNRITVWAATNPGEPSGREPAALHDKNPGYGIVRFDKRARTITMECWPRAADLPQYPGWPKTIAQSDGDGRKPSAWLPLLRVTGLEDPVIQVVDEAAGEVVYTLRIRGTELRPPVYGPGPFTVRVGEPGTDQWVEITSLSPSGDVTSLTVEL